MTERQAWFCPSCQKHHAPHIQTCPGGTGGGPLISQPRPTFPPGYSVGGFACGCASEDCRKNGCASLRSASRQAWASYNEMTGAH